MLARWSLGNFKSFHERESLDIAPLTLLCGSNSSGKSSVLQSMLLIKQTLEHSPAERVIALNGPLVQLGTFSDILNDKSITNSEKEIELGWKIENQVSEDQNSSIYAGDYQIKHSCLDFKFDTVGRAADKSILELQPDLKASHMSAVLNDNDDNSHEVNVEIERVNGRGRKIQYNSSTLGDDVKLRFRVKNIDEESKESAGPTYVRSKIVGANVNHFAPSALIVRYDRNRRNAKMAAIMLADLTGVRRFRLPLIKVSEPLIKIIAEALAPLLQQTRTNEIISRLLDSAGEDLTVEAFSQRVRVLPFSTRRAVREALSLWESDLEVAAYKDLGADQTIAIARVDPIMRVTNFTDRYFRFLLRYLGPLRADPRPLYPLQALSSPTDVGPKGEQTAAVLHLNAKRKVKTIASAAFKGCPTDAASTETTLAEAVADWLKYLGVAEAFETIEKGKLGHELRVRTSGASEFQDLTNVGVGVSQVLPIVVTCLLAAPGSTVILEQPELHLHPAVQARLADFFIAMILLKKQCIIETHSEHLIERIRYRVVQDRKNTIHGGTKIYFFCKENGSTSIKDIAVTKFGSIEDWPEDFFDQSQIANEEIVLMALQRHKEETDRKES